MLENKAAILTGGSGFLGKYFLNGLSKNHKKIFVLDTTELNKEVIKEFSENKHLDIEFYSVNISDEQEVKHFFSSFNDQDVLVTTLLNAAANNPSVTSDGMIGSSKFENFDVEEFNLSVTNSLLGTALMCREFVKYTDNKFPDQEKLILNIGSDLSVIAPDNRIYGEEIFKPIEYSVSKHGILGLTKYLAVYLADKNFRVNTLSPTGVFNNQSKEFVEAFSKTVPLGRMVEAEELITHVSYLTSSDSKFLTGQNILVDGGRSVW